eukprot:sb/3471323/
MQIGPVDHGQHPLKETTLFGAEPAPVRGDHTRCLFFIHIVSVFVLLDEALILSLKNEIVCVNVMSMSESDSDGLPCTTLSGRSTPEISRGAREPFDFLVWNALQSPRLRRRATPQKGPVAYSAIFKKANRLRAKTFRAPCAASYLRVQIKNSSFRCTLDQVFILSGTGDMTRERLRGGLKFEFSKI